MKCEYCGQEIPMESEFVLDDHYFCSKQHRYSWQNANENLSIQTPRKDKTNYKKIIIITISVVVIIAGFMIGLKMADIFYKSETSIDKQLMNTAKEINKSCPIYIDKDTRLDNTISGPGKTLAYNYTLVNLQVNEVDIEALKGYIRPRILNIIKTLPEMKDMRENGVTFIYRYSYKNSIYAFDLKITPNDYRD